MWEALLVALAGLAVGLLGHRLFHAALGLFGFLLGATLALVWLGPLLGPILALVAAVVVGVIGAVVVTAIQRAAFFLAGAAIGGVIGLAVGALFGGGVLGPLLGLVLALIGGFAGMAGERYAIAAGTGLVGAWLLLVGAAAILTGERPDLHLLPELGPPGVAQIVLVALGIGFAGAQLAFERDGRGARAEAA